MADLKTTAYQLIKARIIDGTYAPLSFLDENAISGEIGSSRTPVREALLALEKDQYVQIWPKRGIVVAPFTMEDALAIFDVRELLEPWIVENYASAIPKEEIAKARETIVRETCALQKISQTRLPGMAMDHCPHTLFLKYCGNRYVYDFVKHIEELSARKPSVLNFSKPPMEYTDQRRDKIIAYHTHMIDLLEADKIGELADYVRDHVRMARLEYQQYWFE